VRRGRRKQVCRIGNERTEVGHLESRHTGSACAQPAVPSTRRAIRFGSELRAAFVDRGQCWGGVTLLRHYGRPDFTQEEADVLSRISQHIDVGLRMALVREALPDEGARSPGIVVLDDRCQVESLTPEAEQWMRELLLASNVTSAELPRPVYEVASRV